MASRRLSAMAIAGLVLVSAAALTCLLSMCTPNWLESLQQRNTGFGKIGIWEACFNDYVDEKDALGKRYNGCHGLLSFELRTLYQRINPSWLLGIQIMMSLALLILIVCLTFLIMYFVRAISSHNEKNFIMATFILSFITGGLEGVSVIMFGIQADTDRQWLPHPDSNYLSWSFGIAVLSAFFILFAGMCLLVEWMRISQQEKNRIRRQNMALTSKPASRY